MHNLDGQALEERFIQRFVMKRFRERASLELRSAKKRREFFSRLCHGYARYLIPSCLHAIDQAGSTEENLYALAVAVCPDRGQICYTMGYDNDSTRGVFLEYAQSIALYFESSMALMTMLSPDIALFQAEADFCKPHRFFLYL